MNLTTARQAKSKSATSFTLCTCTYYKRTNATIGKKHGGKNHFVRVELINGRSADVWCDKEIVELIQTYTDGLPQGQYMQGFDLI